MTKQIAVSDEVYDCLNTLRRYKGHKWSFNTVIKGLIREALIRVNGSELYRKLQWHGIQAGLKQMQEQGWIPTYNLHYAHVMRLMANGAFNEASEYICEQLPKNSDITVGTADLTL